MPAYRVHGAFGQITDAIAREKQIKAGSRKKTLDLINGFKPEWRDLSSDLLANARSTCLLLD